MKRNALGCLLGLCIGQSVACDRSWREEQFTAPGEGPSENEERPRVRPSVAPSANPNSTNVGSPAMSGGANDAGVPVTTPGEVNADAGSFESDSSVAPDDEHESTQSTNTSAQGTGTATATSGTGTNESQLVTDVVTDTQSTEPANSSNTGSETYEPEAFSKAALLRAAGECALGQYETFAEQADTLVQAVDALVEDPNALPEAQQAFLNAMSSFQVVEQFRVGPAARAMDPGGKDLRDHMYAYPQINRCQVDRNLVTEVYATSFDDVLLNARGFGALEYLLFERGNDNVCSVGIDINVHGTWAELSQEELDSRRAAYASVVAQDIEQRAAELVEEWLPSGGNFIASLEDAGDGSEVFSNQQAALNALSHALFYLEKEVKDYKLGWPLGLVAECTSGSCPGAAELPYSGQSGPSIAQNLKGFRLLFEGCGADYAGFGFDDWLRAADPDGDLDQRMLSRLDDAEGAVAALPRLLEDAFYDAPDEARAVHTAVKSVTDLLKTEFVTVLNLDLPMTAEGDND